jgi:glycosyltransferase involved in cell wall biosynthesis
LCSAASADITVKMVVPMLARQGLGVNWGATPVFVDESIVAYRWVWAACCALLFRGKTMPLVSVVIPAYNCALYLQETIESMLAQEAVGDMEVIVVNDGSTDHTADIARRFGGVVRVIDQPNAGVSSARNRGIRAARGDFVALVDHDDYWFPSKLAGQLAAFAAHPEVDVVFSGFRRWHADGPDCRFREPLAFAHAALPQGVDPDYSGWIYHQMLLDSWVLTSTALARAQVFRITGDFDETLPFSEDWDFWLRVSRAHQFLKLREVSTLYRQHASQGSRVTREVDYRTRLLEKAHAQWGLSSRDGRCLAPGQFRRQLAVYSASFGLGHLSGEKGASRALAARAFFKALAIDPSYWRSLAYLALTPLGWKPSVCVQSS